MKRLRAYLIGASTLVVAAAQADTGMMALNSGVGMPLRGERADRATYYLVQGGRAIGPDGHRADVAFYYFGDFGYYGYPWGYDYGSSRSLPTYQDHGYPYDNGYYFYSSNPHSGPVRSQSLFKHLDTFQLK